MIYLSPLPLFKQNKTKTKQNKPPTHKKENFHKRTFLKQKLIPDPLEFPSNSIATIVHVFSFLRGITKKVIQLPKLPQFFAILICMYILLPFFYLLFVSSRQLTPQGRDYTFSFLYSSMHNGPLLVLLDTTII